MSGYCELSKRHSGRLCTTDCRVGDRKFIRSYGHHQCIWDRDGAPNLTHRTPWEQRCASTKHVKMQTQVDTNGICQQVLSMLSQARSAHCLIIRFILNYPNVPKIFV
jgi:hypothetical protein